MRDRLVANQDRYDIRELIGALLEHVELHSDVCSLLPRR